MKATISLIFSLLVLFCAPAAAQEAIEVETEPKTKLEAFQARTGVVIIKGYSRIGSTASQQTTGQQGGSILVEALEFQDAVSRSKEYGISLEVREGGNNGRRNFSFIDYDEIDPLLKGLEYLSRIDSSVTQLNRFEADYQTKGEAVFSAFSTRGGNVTITVSAGILRPVTSFFRLEDLKNIRGLFIEAKNHLDAIQQK